LHAKIESLVLKVFTSVKINKRSSKKYLSMSINYLITAKEALFLEKTKIKCDSRTQKLILL